MAGRVRIGVALLAASASVAAGATSYEECDLATLEQAMRSGELTSRALTLYYLERIRRIDQPEKGLKSILEINPEAVSIAEALDKERTARGARGPLHGIPVVLKGNIETADRMSTSAGSLALAHYRAPSDADLVRALRGAGAVILGKANLSEWANFRSGRSSSGWSAVGGQTRNAYDLDRTPCGSSSGSAVAVAANLVALAVGTETDGSIICPSAVNGVVGIKPTWGIVSTRGIIPVAHSQDTAGPMARTVTDAAMLLSVMTAKDPRPLSASSLVGKRIGVYRTYEGAGRDDRVDEIFERAIAALQASGAEIVDPLDLDLDVDGLRDAESEVLHYEFKADINEYLGRSSAPIRDLSALIEFNRAHAAQEMSYFGQDRLERALAKGSLSDSEYAIALSTGRRIARDAIDTAMSRHRIDAIVAPSNGPAWLIDPVAGDSFVTTSAYLAAVSGYASISVPAGFVRHLPIGLSFIGKANSDWDLIDMAYTFEQATKVRRPPGAHAGSCSPAK